MELYYYCILTVSGFKLLFITYRGEPHLSFQNVSKLCTALPKCCTTAIIVWVAWDCYEGRIFLFSHVFLAMRNKPNFYASRFTGNAANLLFHTR